jgi:hypothetical protein
VIRHHGGGRWKGRKMALSIFVEKKVKVRNFVVLLIILKVDYFTGKEVYSYFFFKLGLPL